MSGRVRADIVLPQAEEAGGMQGFLTLLFDDFAALQVTSACSSLAFGPGHVAQPRPWRPWCTRQF